MAEGHGRYVCFALEYFIERLRVLETKLVSHLRYRKATCAEHFLGLFYKLVMNMLSGILTGIYAQHIAQVVGDTCRLSAIAFTVGKPLPL